MSGLWFLLAFLGVATSLHATSFTATLDRDTITLGESVILTLQFEDGDFNGTPTVPAMANLQVTHVGSANQYNFINGRRTSSVTHNFSVTPRQAGEFTIPALTAVLGGQKYVTQPLRLKVLSAGAPSPEAMNSGSEVAFMKLGLPKGEVYLGEPITANLELYFRDNVRGIANFQVTSLPADGMSVGKTGQGQEQRLQIGNSVYRKVPLAVILTPVKAGTVQVGPVTASVVVQVASGTRRRDPFFEQFGMRDPFNDNVEQKRLILTTDSATIRSLPLPAENVPPNFSGAVGSYELTVTAGPTNLTAGDPITVRVQISGRGLLDGVNLPEQPAWHDFKTYPPTSKVDATDQSGLVGTKSFEQIIVPQTADIHELPAFSFSFFDPETKAYRTLTQPAVPLLVRPGGSAPMPVIAANAAKPATPPVPQDIVPIKQRFGDAARVGPPLATQSWFLAVQSVPVLAWMTVLIWRKRSDSLANNPRLRRQRHVAQLVRNGRNDLRRLAAEKNSDAFFATLVRLLQEQLGERLNCPASSITEAVIDERLRPAGVPESTLTALHELFQTCNLARYAPIKSSQELAALVPKLENVLQDLEGLKV